MYYSSYGISHLSDRAFHPTCSFSLNTMDFTDPYRMRPVMTGRNNPLVARPIFVLIRKIRSLQKYFTYRGDLSAKRDRSRSSRAKSSGPDCSKLTTSLVNMSLKFRRFISQICKYFLLKKCAKLLSFFLTKNFSIFGYKGVKHLTS